MVASAACFCPGSADLPPCRGCRSAITASSSSVCIVQLQPCVVSEFLCAPNEVCVGGGGAQGE